MAFPNAIPFVSKSIVRAFLIGYGFNSLSKTDLQITPIKLEEQLLTVSVTAGSGIALNNVQFSYIIFAPSQLPFASYGGSGQKNTFQGVVSTDIHRTVYQSQYKFYGISALTLQDSSSVSFDMTIDDNFILSLAANSVIDQLTVFYLIFGVPASDQCPYDTAKYVYQSSCVSQCPTGTYLYIYSNRGYACRTCSALMNLVLNSDKTGCQCSPSSTMVNGSCVSSPAVPSSSSGLSDTPQ